jgi:GTP-binding protein
MGQPKVLLKEIDGVTHEPVENLVVNVPDRFQGRVIEAVTQRRGELISIETKSDQNSLTFKSHHGDSSGSPIWC